MSLQELGTIMGILIVDRVGRRKMLIQSTCQSLVAMVVLAAILARYTSPDTGLMSAIPSRAAIILVSGASTTHLSPLQRKVLHLPSCPTGICYHPGAHYSWRAACHFLLCTTAVFKNKTLPFLPPRSRTNPFCPLFSAQ